MSNAKPIPLVSIITVTYNAAATLARTIESVVGQTCFPQVEYIVVDGASTDGTLSVVARYRPHIARLVSEPDRGLYDAMNKGLALATGRYVCFLNAGDCLYSPDTLQRLFQPFGAGAWPDIIYGETALVDQEGRFLRMRRLQAPRSLHWKSFRRGMLVCHQSFLVKRALAGRFDTSYRYSADFDWCIRAMKKASHIHNSRLILTNYLHQGLTTRHRRASLIERFRIMTRHYGLLSTVAHHLWFVLRLALLR